MANLSLTLPSFNETTQDIPSDYGGSNSNTDTTSSSNSSLSSDSEAEHGIVITGEGII